MKHRNITLPERRQVRPQQKIHAKWTRKLDAAGGYRKSRRERLLERIKDVSLDID